MLQCCGAGDVGVVDGYADWNLLLDGYWPDDLLDVADAFEECFGEVSGEPEVFEFPVWAGSEEGQVEEAVAAEKDVPFFQVPTVQTDGAGSEGTRQDLYHLPEVQNRICEKKLIKRSVSCVWIY